MAQVLLPPSTSPSPSRRKSRKPGAAQQWASTPGHLFNFQLKRANTLNEVEMHLHLRPRTAGQIAGHYLSIDIATREWLDNCFRLSRNKTKMKTNKKNNKKKGSANTLLTSWTQGYELSALNPCWNAQFRAIDRLRLPSLPGKCHLSIRTSVTCYLNYARQNKTKTAVAVTAINREASQGPSIPILSRGGPCLMF